MKRSSFLKSLGMLFIAPKIVLEMGEETYVQKRERLYQENRYILGIDEYRKEMLPFLHPSATVYSKREVTREMQIVDLKMNYIGGASGIRINIEDLQ